MDLHGSAPSMAVFIQFTSRLAALWCWLAIATAHAVLLAAVSLGLWAAQVSPPSSAALGQLLDSRVLSALTLLTGLSFLSVWGYGVRHIAKTMHGRILERLRR